jgi:hypothetical protein
MCMQQNEENSDDEDEDDQRSSIDNYVGISIKVRPYITHYSTTPNPLYIGLVQLQSGRGAAYSTIVGWSEIPRSACHW